MNRRTHARYARLLIEACGGLEEAAGACRVRKTQLSDYQSPHGEGYMPADVIVDLELLCGQPIYSRAMQEAQREVTLARDLKEEACEAVEATADLQRKIRLAAADNLITPREREDLARAHAAAMEELRQVGDLLKGEP